MRVNDVATDPSGRFWITTMAYDTEPGTGAPHRLGSPHPSSKD
jgi:sugar lactone lactonase YvrE